MTDSDSPKHALDDRRARCGSCSQHELVDRLRKENAVQAELIQAQHKELIAVKARYTAARAALDGYPTSVHKDISDKAYAEAVEAGAVELNGGNDRYAMERWDSTSEMVVRALHAGGFLCEPGSQLAEGRSEATTESVEGVVE